MTQQSTARGHEHYDHYDPEMVRRLDGFYGRVDASLNERIAQHVVGQSVLDVGCGFGSLTEHLRRRGFKATGVDLLAEGIAAGKARYLKPIFGLPRRKTWTFPPRGSTRSRSRTRSTTSTRRMT